jgi:glutamine synthetase
MGGKPSMSVRGGGFIERFGLWTAAQKSAADKVRKAIAAEGIESVRVAFADQHGILRGKTYTSRAFESVLADGCALTSTLLLKDTSHRTAFPIWRKEGGLDPERLIGASDFILVPDPVTFRPIPWAKKSAWILCDGYYRDGTAVPFSTRHLLRKALSGLESRGYSYLAGIELEFSVYRLVDARLTHESCTHPARPPEVTPLTHGYQHLTEGRYDELEPVLEILREMLLALGMPLRTLEVEFGPSQVELTFDPVAGIEGADQLVLTRSAIKQVCKRHGYHATFMTRPAFANAFSSGWHLHQSLLNRNGRNAFASDGPGELLSPTGKSYLAGLLAHAKDACLLSTPTINGYKRYSRSHALAPNRIVWGKDNRGVMLRVVGEPGDPATHIENRVGEPTANPYLYFVSQIACGLSGIERNLVPPAAVDTPYDESWERLPRNIAEAIAHFRASQVLREALGDAFVDYFSHLKEFELKRFLEVDVTDWEQREYFANF